MVRKNTARVWLHDPDRDTKLDGRDHNTIADHFNRCARFICYDDASFYSQYAAICGCVSIVAPGAYPNRAAWVADWPIARYGVAYGLEDTDHAIATRHRVLAEMRAFQASGRSTVKDFVARTRAGFGFPPPRSVEEDIAFF